MAISVKRKTGMMGSGSDIRIVVNDKDIFRVKEGKTTEINLVKNKAKIQAKQAITKSNILEVKDGDSIIVNANKIVLPLSIATLLAVIMLPSFFKVSAGVSVIIMILYLFICMRIDFFVLEKIEE